MLGWVIQWWVGRRERKADEARQRELAVRRKVMSRIGEGPAFTPTNTYETVKKAIDDVTEKKKQTRNAIHLVVAKTDEILPKDK
jgi:hypothetical protein